ncbi:hypothetical protein POVCU1_003250 [Plasmodium ovale curtisi]|uniref:Sushi domain-containing protein n=1 Tax=Plasmodium ovale curtisi TaxID=864141 RepID=A0A1A8VKM6_PLAOA|nr:hypothetical protein POVCU1_003250 [Plasmodium ovale curtisi]
MYPKWARTNDDKEETHFISPLSTQKENVKNRKEGRREGRKEGRWLDLPYDRGEVVARTDTQNCTTKLRSMEGIKGFTCFDLTIHERKVKRSNEKKNKMNILSNILLSILCYETVTNAKETTHSHNFSNGVDKLEDLWRGASFEPMKWKQNGAGEGLQTVETSNQKNEIKDARNHSLLRSKISFIERNKGKETGLEKKKIIHGNKADVGIPHIGVTDEKLVQAKSHITREEIRRRGENFYINGGTTEYDYSNDEDFFKAFHSSNNKKEIKTYSPCSAFTDVNSCTKNRECFYDNVYQTCFQICNTLEERNCLQYTECKFTQDGCQNEGYLKFPVFGSDLGSGVRACELFESEGSCYLMEKLYSKLDKENKTNFNCVWLSYKHEFKTHKGGYHHSPHKKVHHKEHHEGNHEGHHEGHHEGGGIIHIKRGNNGNTLNEHIKSHVLSANKPRNLMKNEKFLSLLELNLSEKKKKKKGQTENKSVNKKSDKKNVKKKNSDDDDAEEEEEEEEGDVDFNDMNDEEGEDKENTDDHDGVDETDEEDFDDEFEKKEKKKVTNKGSKEGEKEKSAEGAGASGSDGESDEGNIKIAPTDLIQGNAEIVTENIISDSDPLDKNVHEHAEGDMVNKENKENAQRERDVFAHNFHEGQRDTLQGTKHSEQHHGEPHAGMEHGLDEWVSVETHICANLNERPNPAVLLEGALLAEKEAELIKIKKKYNVTDNEICVRPSNEHHISLYPDKKYYLLGEQIEFTCKKGYKLIGTTNKGVCVGRNKIVPNISCESLSNLDETEKENIQKLNNLINSGMHYAITAFVPVAVLLLSLFP